ncbi:MAG: hypothetical protein SFY69_02900 [Planctomycetota bacterium]|nr:hypothetical protein [Planctomycetota bacterium]
MISAHLPPLRWSPRALGRAWALGAAALLGLASCESEGPRDTPEATIASFSKDVREGRAERLGDYLYADNPDMRRLMRRTGVLLGNLQALGESVQAKFPDEVAALKAEAEKAAAEGRSGGFFSQMASQMGGTNRRRRANVRAGDNAQSSFNDAIQQLLADPYAWAEESEKRLTTAFLTDDSVALLWDSKPILPPLGMSMRRADDGKWYVVPPTESPTLAPFMPKTPEQYQMFGSLIATFDNLVIDLRKDVDEGRVRSLDELSNRAGERAFLPLAAAFYAYSNYTTKMRQNERGEATPPAKPDAPKPDAPKPDGTTPGPG